MCERVEAVGGVGGAQCVDVVEHLAPGAERALRDEVGLDPGEALGNADAVEHLEAEDELCGRARTLGEHADAEDGVEEAEAGEALSLGAIERAIYPVGFYRTKARTLRRLARALRERHEGRVPDDLEALLALPGVGRKTANLVVTEAFAGAGICVDTHVHRITNRWGYVRTRRPVDTEHALRAKLPSRH